jgi:hypothetical protein
VEKIRHIIISLYESAWQDHNIILATKSLETVARMIEVQIACINVLKPDLIWAVLAIPFISEYFSLLSAV